jgi:hypothetical protein
VALIDPYRSTSTLLATKGSDFALQPGKHVRERNRREFTGGWKHAFSLVSREHVLSLADQAIVSVTGFLTTLLIARLSGSTQLGIYALGLSLLLSLVAFQESLILQPYLIQRFYPEGTAAERAGASLALSILFSLGSILVLTVAAILA